MESAKNKNPNSNSSDEEEKISINLKVTKTVAMEVKRSETIGNIKSVLRAKEGGFEGFPEFLFNGDRLKDDQRVVDCGIHKDSTLCMIIHNSAKIKVIIPLNRKCIVVEVRPYYTIQDIRSIILDMEGIHPDQYNLFFAGKVLEDDSTLLSLNMQSESTIHLVFKPKDTLSFSVIKPTGEIENLKVNVLYSVSDVKAIVGGLTGISVSDFDLSYKEQPLEDSKSLACYNIPDGSIIEMSVPKFQIFVKAWSGKTITLYVHQRNTVQDVKDKALQKLGGRDCFQSILFCGKRLEAGRDLAYYNIPKHATLHMVFAPSTVLTASEEILSEIGLLSVGALNSTTTIRDLKTMIQETFNTPVKELCFQGKRLEDEFSVAQYHIGMHDTLTVLSEYHSWRDW